MEVGAAVPANGGVVFLVSDEPIARSPHQVHVAVAVLPPADFLGMTGYVLAEGFPLDPVVVERVGQQVVVSGLHGGETVWIR